MAEISGSRRKLICPRCRSRKTEAITIPVIRTAIRTSVKEKPLSRLPMGFLKNILRPSDFFRTGRGGTAPGSEIAKRVPEG
jgi:hypothetical protein